MQLPQHMIASLSKRNLHIRFLQVLAFNTLIACGVALGSPHAFYIDLVYSQSIGLLIWTWIDVLGPLIAGLDRSRRFMLCWVPLGIVIGYIGGNFVGDQFTGFSFVDFWRARPNIAVGFLILTFAAGVAASYYFASEDRFAKNALAQEALQRQATQAQLALLQSQLEPHMLFNTLANLRALIGTDANRATAMLDRLNDYLRATLGASRASVQPLSNEFARLSDYLELMAIRMGPRLSFALDLPTALANVPIPSLLLQPLVENSIKHGLEPKVAGGRIEVSARLAPDGRVHIQVRDTGVGLAPHAQAPEGFGLAHVKERLQNAYGVLGTIEIIANNDCQTVTLIKFPVNIDKNNG